MCIAIPGKVVEVDGLRAKVDYSGNQVMVNTGLVTPKVGQYVLVHAGCAIEVMEKDKAEELIELFADIEEMGA
ncbi:MAG: HypC/HybG/HupF family hydrogenase formation chaperone [Firmicutes bacterium]|nr:HypC/HybG/HupF family hydrogenase formation chaperone [Bacillota bacterium]